MQLQLGKALEPRADGNALRGVSYLEQKAHVAVTYSSTFQQTRCADVQLRSACFITTAAVNIKRKDPMTN